MACVLTRRPDGVFTGKTGEKVEIGVRSPLGARLVRLTYGGKEDGDAPFTLTIERGSHKLLVVALGAAGGVQRMQILENPSDASPCHLKNFFWSPSHFFTALDIEGI